MNFSDSDERTTEEGTPAAGSREFMTKVVCECNGKGACLHANLAFGAYKDERTTEEGTPAAGSQEFMTKVVCESNGK